MKGTYMADVEVTCVTKPHPESPYEHIAELGSPAAGWKWPCKRVIASIDAGTNTFFVRDPLTRGIPTLKSPACSSAARGLTELPEFGLARFPVDPSAGQPGDHHLDQSDQRRHGGKTQWKQMRDHGK
jgi:hypothetical protein